MNERNPTSTQGRTTGRGGGRGYSPRHKHIGKGRIGKPGFAQFVNDARFRSVPFILETPKGKDRRGTELDKVNLRRLRSLLN